MRTAGVVRRALKLIAVALAGFAVLALVAVAYLRTQVTVRGPVLHAIAGLGGAQPSDAALGSLRLAPGFSAAIHAQGLGPARVLRFTASGDLLVSITRHGKVLLLERDADGDGRADGVRTLLQGLDRPHGIDLADGWLYVAETGAVRRDHQFCFGYGLGVCDLLREVFRSDAGLSDRHHLASLAQETVWIVFRRSDLRTKRTILFFGCFFDHGFLRHKMLLS